MQGEGLTNEGRHHLLLLCKQAHDKRGIAESLHCQWRGRVFERLRYGMEYLANYS